MLHYCPENVSAYHYSQLETVTIKFQNGCENYQFKMAVKNHKACLFRSKSNLENLGMSKNVALLSKKCISSLLFHN